MSKQEVDELAKLAEKPEVFAPSGSFEAPVRDVKPGEYYAYAEERLPGITEVEGSVEADLPVSPQEKLATQGFSLDRRDVLRLFGASAVASSAGCIQRPEEHIVSYIRKPRDQVPGVATHYASTCDGCASSCGIVVKTKGGRPVKIEGHDEHPVSQGALCGVGQAGLQALYHPERLKGPRVRVGERLDETTWDDVFERIAKTLGSKAKIGILTGAPSGHALEFYKEVLSNMGQGEDQLYTWEPNGLFTSIAKAHEFAFGELDLPRVELSSAQLVVGISSDFLDVGTAPVFHGKGFSRGHAYALGKRGRFVAFESNYTLTGAKADERHVINPGAEVLVTLLLVRSLMEEPGSRGSVAQRKQIADILELQKSVLDEAYAKVGIEKTVFDELAHSLLQMPSVILAGGSSVFDHNATQLQLAAIFANILIGSYGATLMFEDGWMPCPVVPGDLKRLLSNAEDLDALIVVDTNPIFSAPPSWEVRKVLERIPFVVSIQNFPNEMDDVAEFVLPNNHYLESWGDAQPVAGFWSMRQPVVRSTTNSRQAEDILLWVLAYMEKSLPYKDYRAYLRKRWQKIYDMSGTKVSYDHFLQAVTRRGFVGRLQTRTVAELSNVRDHFRGLPEPLTELSLISPLDSRLHDGRYAHLPVLQEAGDPITTITWDTWAGFNPHTMEARGIRQGQVVKVKSSVGEIEVTAFAVPGVHKNLVVVPRGNGHQDHRSTISYKNGVNPLPLFLRAEDRYSGQPVTSNQKIEVVVTEKRYRLAALQKTSDIGERSDIIKKHSLATLKRNFNKKRDLDHVPDLFPKLEEGEYKWGMSIDLDRCTGCGACMIACSVENNVPQVGREQILLGRTMHWIRLDRYFHGDLNNPKATFQPVMCQHCNHAPCEAVCPVYATTHDEEGMNAMTYNRCVGTRYCANACPYKVRRFNWWTHKWGEMGKRQMDRNPRAVNPDVTVRTRGVMEKCSLCVGRIRDAKHVAKAEGRKVKDRDVRTACQQTCPADAIEFGNVKDPTSRISSLRTHYRAYTMLNGDPDHHHYGLKTLPSVNYLAEVTLKEAPGKKETGSGH
ncbi:MAG: 4Fe-4S dicluster domain-containing protein [Zetaproteobacteria bacterium]|nr:4Fe-4S dicluster domain-containing protein [Zetaproteobacteria bacterium]